MINYLLNSPQTGDDFNPVIVFAIAATALVALIFLLVGMKRGK